MRFAALASVLLYCILQMKENKISVRKLLLFTHGFFICLVTIV